MALKKGYRPPWLDEKIKASRSRESAKIAARQENLSTGYVPPPPKPKAYVPKHLMAGGVPASVLPDGTPAGVDIGISAGITAGLPDLSYLVKQQKRIYESYTNTLRETGTLADGGTGLSPALNEIIRKRVRMKNVEQRQKARTAARTANLATGAEPSEGTIPSGWGGLTDLNKKKPYRDKVPRLYDYSQQQEKFGSFEDYQKAAEARKHGYVPNRYDEIADYLGKKPEEEEGAGAGYGSGYGSGYPYFPGANKAKELYQPGHRPDWGLWNTFVTATTWNM